MAGRTVQMRQLKQVLQLHDQGHSNKSIVRITGLSKNTVKKYLRHLNILLKKDKKLTVRDLIKLEDPILEGVFHPGNPAYKTDDQQYNALTERIPAYLKELEKTGVTKRLLWEEYIQEIPKGYKYTQFCFHLRQHSLKLNPSAVLSHDPADKLYVDFSGKKLSYIDRQTGEVIECQVFVACLPFSDYGFVMAVHSQKIEDFINALKCCLEYLGGVPKAIVPDNLKSAVIRANRYEPAINDALNDFGNHYGCAIIPTRSKKPKDKALVENHVKIIYTRVFAKLRNHTFFSLSDLNQAIASLTKAHNQTRMQRHDYCRQERFLAKEKMLLSPLPEHPFKLKYHKKLRVAQNNHIYLSEDKCHYSVPYKLIGQFVKVIYCKEMVRIYFEGKQMALHSRGIRDRGYATIEEHLSSFHQEYNKRNPDYYKKRASNVSETLEMLVKALFTTGRHPEQMYRSCEGLLSLSRKTDKTVFDKACQKALEHKNYSYPFVENIIRNKTYDQEDQQRKPTSTHENVRGSGYFENQVKLKQTKP